MKTPEAVAKENTTALAKLDLKPIEKFKVRDPITKEVRTITVDRRGHTEYGLIKALADPKLSRDRKDHELSMYLFSRGAEGASMMLDLMRYKGEHTKETRVFKSQMRFDFEAFVSMMIEHLRGQADRTAKIFEVDLEKEIKDYRAWLLLPNNKGKEYTYWDFCGSRRSGNPLHANPNLTRVEAVLISEAIFNLDEAQRLEDSRKNIVAAREREKGGGIYVAKDGKVYSMEDPELTEIIKADREATAAIEKE